MTRISCSEPEQDRREIFEGQQVLTTLSVGADMERRMIFLVGQVDEMMLYKFIAAFKVMDQTEGPIAIFMASPGGSMYDGAAIYDTIRTAHNPVVIQGTGYIMSMASIILQAGTLRFLTPETRFMVHNASVGAEGGVGAVSSYVKDVEVLNERYAQILSERTKKSMKVVEGWLQKETYLSAAEAVKLGLADAVTTTRYLPKNYSDGVKELNRYLPEGYAITIGSDQKLELGEKKSAKKAKGKKKAK